jgi:hypothetical protein
MYRHGYEQVFEQAKYALMDCKFKIEFEDRIAGKIDAAAGVSMASWGESIKVFVGVTAGGTQVTVTSSPYMMDWGKSKKNVANVLNALDGRMRSIPVQPTMATAGTGHLPPVASSTPPKPDTTVAVGLALLNAFVAFLLGFFYIGLWFILGVFVFGIAVILFFGSILILTGNYKAGAIMCIIGGAVTIPIGITGIIAGQKAWSYGK